jgi:DNA helicase-2/ATP-dependent DNA helicase PcrA
VRDIIAYLLVLHNPNDEVAVRRVINTPPRGIGDKSVDALSDWARREGIALYHALPNVAEIADIPTRGRSSLITFRDMMDGLMKEPRESLARLIETVIKASGYLNGLTGEEGHERKSNLDELITLGANFDKMAAEHPDDDALPRGLEGFLETVRLSSDQDDLDENADRVPLMTLHTAKGLEFPAVFMPGCEDGLLPHERSRDLPRQMEEERRLFFVGVTRAKRRLTLLHARFRRIRGQLMRCVQSPFLGEMPSDTIKDLDETTGTRPAMFDRETVGERPWDRRPERSESLGGGGYKAPGAQRIVQPEKDPKTGFVMSEVVRHAVFGVGRVTGFTTIGGRGFVKVRFNTVGEKTLDPTIAKLQKMAPV